MPPRQRYQRGFSFSGFQANQPKTPLPGQRVDIELDEIAGAIDGVGAAVDAISENATSSLQRVLAAADTAVTSAAAVAGAAAAAVKEGVSLISYIPERYRAAILLRSIPRDGSVDLSPWINEAFAAAAGNFQIYVPNGVYPCSDIKILSLLSVTGASRSGVLFFMLPNKSASDLFYTDNAYTLMGTQNTAGAPYGYQLRNMTLDGNGQNNFANSRGRGLYSFACATIIDAVDIRNCWRQGLYQEYPIRGGLRRTVHILREPFRWPSHNAMQHVPGAREPWDGRRRPRWRRLLPERPDGQSA